MKRLLYLLIYIATVLPASAQTIVRDAQDGLPVIQASVYDEQGKIIGVTDADGRLPAVGTTTHIRLTHMAYHPLEIETSQIGRELFMEPVTYRLKDVVVKGKHDAYCLKLACYFRQYMVNGKGTIDELPPIVSFVDGICHLYVFTDDYKTTRCVQVAKRMMITEDMTLAIEDDDMADISIHSLPERYKESMDKTPFTLHHDTLHQTIHVTFNALYPAKSRKVTLSIMQDDARYQSVAAPQLVMDQQQAVYQGSPYGRVSQGSLLAFSKTQRLKGSMKKRGKESYALNLWLTEEFFPVEAEYLTKQEYKADLKAAKGLVLTSDAIDQYAIQPHIPGLIPEMQQKLEQTRRRHRMAQPQARLEVGQRKGKLLVLLHDYDGADSLVCTVEGSDNQLEVDYNLGKVLRIDARMLRPGAVTVTMRNRLTGEIVAEVQTKILMENGSIDLSEVTVTGSKKKQTPLNSYQREPPRGYKPGDPRIGRAAKMIHLLTPLGIREARTDNGEVYLTTNGNAGLKIFVDGIVETDHDYVLNNLLPTDVKAIEYFTPNDPRNSIFGVRPRSWSGLVPGVLFIFLKDGSEVE